MSSGRDVWVQYEEQDAALRCCLAPCFIETDVNGQLVVDEEHRVTGERRDALVRLAQHLVGLRHPHLPAVRSVRETEQAVHIVSDFGEGVSLRSLLSSARQRGVRVALGVELRIVLDVLSALVTLHALERSAGTEPIYRVIGPECVVIDPSGRARLRFVFGGDLPEPGNALYPYVAPEAWRGEPTDGTSDLFGVGLILCSALTRDSSDGRDDHLSIRDIWATPLFDLAHRAISERRADRIPTAVALAEGIRELPDAAIARAPDVAEWAVSCMGEVVLARRSSAPPPPSARPEPFRFLPSDSRMPVAVPVPSGDVTAHPVDSPKDPLDLRAQPADAPKDSLDSRARPADVRARRADAPKDPLDSRARPADAPLRIDTLAPQETRSQPGRKPKRGGGRKSLVLAGLIAAGGIALAIRAGYEMARPGHDVVATHELSHAALAGCPSGMVTLTPTPADLRTKDTAPASGSHKTLCLDRAEVTTAEYKACSDRGECKRGRTDNDWPGITAEERASFDPRCTLRDHEAHAQAPINCIDWERAHLYCAAHGKRLPTLAEWEVARGLGQQPRVHEWTEDGHLTGTATAPAPSMSPVSRSHAFGFRCATSAP